jgi:hypothetical protein
MEIPLTPELKTSGVVDLKQIAKRNKLSGYSKLRKAELIELLRRNRLKEKSKTPVKEGKKEVSSEKEKSVSSSKETPVKEGKKEVSPEKEKSVITSGKKDKFSIPSTPELKTTDVVDLKQIAKRNKLSGYSKLRKAELIEFLRRNRLKEKSKTPIKEGKKEVSLEKEKVIPSRMKTKSPVPVKEGKKEVTLEKERSVFIPRGESYKRIIGPPENKKKYGLIKTIGSGKYGENFLARNLDKQKGEAEYYAIKILKEHPSSKTDWLKEVECLIDVYQICNSVGILCYHESFIFNDGGKKSYVIVTEYLEGYIVIADYLYEEKSNKPLMFQRIKSQYPDLNDRQINNKVIKEVENIYSQIIDVKNKLTSLCIHHSDLHMENIMYNPKTGKIKVIDLGRCQTPEEELKESKGKTSDFYWKYSDEARLDYLRLIMYNNILNSRSVMKKHNRERLKKLNIFSRYSVDDPVPNCVRKRGPDDLYPKIM